MNTMESSVGLCRSCRHVRQIESAKGSQFTLCRLSETDAPFSEIPSPAGSNVSGVYAQTRAFRVKYLLLFYYYL